MPASRSFWATTSSSGSARSSSASPCRPTCGPTVRCDCRRKPVVVPAKAGTHNHEWSLLHFAVAPARSNHYFLWLWVPACAGGSHPLPPLLETLDQIIEVFEPARVADDPFADAEFGARFRRQALMRGGRGMRHQALGIAEIVGDARQLQCVKAAERAGLAALHLEADQRRARTHLLLHQRRLRMIGAAGIEQPRDF